MTLVNYLTDNYEKHLESNNAKILGLVDAEINELKDVFAAIETSRDIDRAEAMTLDKAGKNIIEYRDKQNDDKYRDTIKVKIRAVKSVGDILTIAEIAESLLGDTLLDVRETWNYSAYYNEPAAIVIRLKGAELNYIPIPLKIAVGGGVRVLYEINLGNNIEVKSQKMLHLFDYDLTNMLYSGLKPQTAIIGRLINKSVEIVTNITTNGFNYKICGTYPDVSTLGYTEKANINIINELKTARFLYPECGTILCGTYPAA